jgi:hypothetical protein
MFIQSTLRKWDIRFRTLVSVNISSYLPGNWTMFASLVSITNTLSNSFSACIENKTVFAISKDLATVFGDLNLLVPNHRYTKMLTPVYFTPFVWGISYCWNLGNWLNSLCSSVSFTCKNRCFSPFFCLTFTKWNLSLIIDLNLFSKFLWAFPLLTDQLGMQCDWCKVFWLPTWIS